MKKPRLQWEADKEDSHVTISCNTNYLVFKIISYQHKDSTGSFFLSVNKRIISVYDTYEQAKESAEKIATEVYKSLSVDSEELKKFEDEELSQKTSKDTTS